MEVHLSALREQLEVVDVLAEKLTYERILAVIETPFAVCDEWRDQWAVCQIERELRRYDVSRLWELWRSANAGEGLAVLDEYGNTRWFRKGIYLSHHCPEPVVE